MVAAMLAVVPLTFGILRFFARPPPPDTESAWRLGPWWYSARVVLTTLGIHPLAAVGVIAVDSMLFGGTVVTGGIGWAISVPVGIALAVAVSLIQRRGSPHDDLGLAVGKGLIVGVLTAIPTPLPSALVAGAGTVGAVTMFRNRRGKHLGDGAAS